MIGQVTQFGVIQFGQVIQFGVKHWNIRGEHITQGRIKQVEQLKVEHIVGQELQQQGQRQQGQRFRQRRLIFQLRSTQLFLRLFQRVRTQCICHIRLKECTQFSTQLGNSQ